MKHTLFLLLAILSCLPCAVGLLGAESQPPPPAAAPNAPPAVPAPPPSAPPQRSAADLEKLVAPIALYPDSLIATVLMAAVYPLEIVQAARFVENTNNLANLDAQPWDENVKALARVPDAIKKLNADLTWTIELGEAFLAQDKAIMDAIQSMRSKAQKAGTLQSNPQQTVVVTNMIVEKTIEQQVVVVTNTVVQIQPTNPEVVYVPSYNPYSVYYPPPAYVYNPYAPLVTFTAGVAMGAIIANNCNWYGGGCYHGGDVDIDIDSNRNVNRNTNRNTDRASTRSTASGQKWQPDQNRLKSSGAPSASSAARKADARGWSGGAGASTANVGARPSTGAAGTRPSAGNTARPSTGTPAANRPSPSPSQGANRPSASPSQGANRPSPSQGTTRPAASPSVSQNRPSSSPSRSSSGDAFGGVSSGGSARASSSRGNASRGGGGGGGRGGGGGGGRR